MKNYSPISSAFIEYLPSPFVTVPVEFPFIFTLTPGSEEPSSSVTIPETGWVFCRTNCTKNHR